VSEASDLASPNKILVVRLGAMGDVIHALPAAMYLKSVFPKAQIGWVIEQRWNSLLEWKFSGRPFPDVVHAVDTRRWRKSPLNPETLDEVLSSLRELRAAKYEVAVDFQGALKSALIALFSGAPRRFGFAEAWEKPASLFYTNLVYARSMHVVRQNLELAAAVTGSADADTIAGSFFEWSPSDANVHAWTIAEMRRLRLETGFAILNPGAGWGAKQWPIERYAEVARELGKDGVRALVNHGPGEEQLARQVEQNSGGHAVAATFNISQLMAITRKASLFIGGDTGPMHLAALLQVPVLAIFGPTDPARNGPHGTRNIVLRDAASVTSHKRQRETEAGLRNITTEQVLKAARELLHSNCEGARA
jgi:heptosyltransferase-1